MFKLIKSGKNEGGYKGVKGKVLNADFVLLLINLLKD